MPGQTVYQHYFITSIPRLLEWEERGGKEKVLLERMASISGALASIAGLQAREVARYLCSGLLRSTTPL